jgi:Uma2 family endonuclease
MVTGTRATVEDVLRLGAQGEHYELIDGELVPMSPTNLEHADIESHIGWVLRNYVLPRRLGKVLVGEPLFGLDREGRLARAPDVAFISRERLRTQPDLRSAFVGAPELAVEIVSPSNTAEDVFRKVHEWLANGTLIVLVVYPVQRGVDVWRENGAVSLRDDDDLNLDSAVPGFACMVKDWFPPALGDEEE